MKRILILVFLLISAIGFGQLSLINVGVSANDHTGDTLRTAFQKTNNAINQVNTNTGNILLKVNIADTATMLSRYARKLSPTFTGVPAAPTAAPGTNTTQIATTAFVIAGLGLKVNISDTANMLVRYINKADTASMLSNYAKNTSVALKVNISDTAAMLSRYINKADTSVMLSNYINKSDTAAMLTNYINKADTSAMLTPYTTFSETRGIVNDSLDGRFGGSPDLEDLAVMKHCDTLLVVNDYQLVLADDGRTIAVTKASGVKITIPADATVDFPEGTTINFYMGGAGIVKFVEAANVLVFAAKDSVTINTQWGWATLRKRATNRWLLFGHLED